MTTRALVIAPGDEMARFKARRDALVEIGAETSDDWSWYVWQTTTAAWNGSEGRVLLAVEPWCAPEDWSGLCDLLRLTGWFTGDPVYDDIGEPGHDLARELWTWDLSRP
jgi:hypothetical protein